MGVPDEKLAKRVTLVYRWVCKIYTEPAKCTIAPKRKGYKIQQQREILPVGRIQEVNLLFESI